MSVSTAVAARKPPVSPHVWALLGYFILALVVTYPAVTHFTTGVPGDLIADRNQNLWNLWWIKEAIGRGSNPFHTNMLYYPYGADLYYHTLGLPQGLIALVPQLLWSLPAAYNTVLLVAFTFSGYGAFRLAKLYVSAPPAFLGGVVFAFTPYTLDALKGQLEVLSVQWMPMYAEAWLRSWQPAVPGQTARSKYTPPVLAGVFFALAAYSSLYYALYLLVFTVAHLLYVTVEQWRSKSDQNPKSKHPQAGTRNPKFLLVPAVALLLTFPLLGGLVSTRNDPRLEVRADPAHRLAHSADLFSFVAPPHDHPLLGSPTSRPGVEEPPIHDYLSLGYVALALSVWGAWARRRDRDVRFWALLGLLALVLSMGSQLQVGRNLTGIPLPFKLVEALPGADAIAKPERFVVLARLCMAVLAACGVARSRFQVPGSKVQSSRLLAALLLALLLVELPIHPRYMEPLPPTAAWQSLARERQRGGLMELPFATQQAGTVSERMLAQTTHGRPIMAGYLSRNYNSPIIDSCSPFWGFISPLDVPREGHEIASPLVVSRPLDVLNFYGITHVALDSGSAGPGSAPLDPKERAAFEGIVSQVADKAPLYKDGDVEIYRGLNEDLAGAETSFHIGGGWYKVEEMGGKPFRWLKDKGATVCVFTPRTTMTSLVMEGTAFAHERSFDVLPSDRTPGEPLYAGNLPANGQFETIRTPPMQWKAGITEIHIRPYEDGTTPKSLDPSAPDERPLSVGFRAVRLESTPQK